MCAVNFIGIGPPKSGTSWLHKNLKKIKEIELPDEKETNFFLSNKKFKKGINWYLNKFKDKSKIHGEISSGYIYLEEHRIRYIKKLFPKLKIIFFIRNPIERLISEFNFQRVYKKKPINKFNLFIKKKVEEDRLYLSKHILKFRKFFPLENFYLVDFEKIKKNPEMVINEILFFLNVKNPNIKVHGLDQIIGKSFNPRFKKIDRIRIKLHSYLTKHEILGFILNIIKGSKISNFYRLINNKKIDEIKYDDENLKAKLAQDLLEINKIFNCNYKY